MFQALRGGGDEIILPKLVKSDDIKTPKKPSPVVQKWQKKTENILNFLLKSVKERNGLMNKHNFLA